MPLNSISSPLSVAFVRSSVFMLCSCFPISKIQNVLLYVPMTPVLCPFTNFFSTPSTSSSFSSFSTTLPLYAHFHRLSIQPPLTPFLCYLFRSICICCVIADIVALVSLFDCVVCVVNGGSDMYMYTDCCSHILSALFSTLARPLQRNSRDLKNVEVVAITAAAATAKKNGVFA